MSVKIVVGEREPIGLALRRFRKLLERTGTTYEMRRSWYFLAPNQIRRKKRNSKSLKCRLATLQAKRTEKQ